MNYVMNIITLQNVELSKWNVINFDRDKMFVDKKFSEKLRENLIEECNYVSNDLEQNKKSYSRMSVTKPTVSKIQ